MTRFLALAALLLQCSAIFCQSPASPPGNSQAPGARSGLQWPLDFNNGQTGLSPAKPTFKSPGCPTPSTTRNHANAAVELDHLFTATCADLNSKLLLSFAGAPREIRPHAKAEPIPTQWPNAKFEPIPTRWPDLALKPIN